jgi:hypothetical protein
MLCPLTGLNCIIYILTGLKCISHLMLKYFQVKLEEGIEMLKILMDYDARTSILDDFDFYDERERALKERKARQQACSTADIPDSLADESVNQLSDSLAQALKLEVNRSNKEAAAAEHSGSSRADAPLSLAHDAMNQTSASLSQVLQLEESNNGLSGSETGGHKN